MFDIQQNWNLALQVVRRFKWLFVAFAYVLLFNVLGIKALFIFVPSFALSAWAYVSDKAREARSMDDFSGDRLFFRYGHQVDSTYISVPIDQKWGFKETEDYAQTLRLSLAQKIAARLPEELAQVRGDIVVADRGTGERKDFIRVCVRSRFGSLLTHFVHYANFGQTITAHYFTYIRGIHNDWDVVKFLLLSPFTIWSWGVPWLLNRYSIVSQLSVYRASSFDGIDLRTMFCLTNKVVYEETEKLLTEAGLITEEIRQVIHNNIYNNNQQNISISHSSGVSLGGVKQSAQAPMPSFGRQPGLGRAS